MKAQYMCAAVALVLVLCGCGGGGGGGTTTPGTSPLPAGTGSAITPEQRAAVLGAVNAKFGSLTGRDPDADNQEMLKFLQSRPEFEAAGIEDTSVWARFTDGRLLIVGNDRHLPLVGGKAISSITASRVATRDVQLPTPTRSRLMEAFGTGFPSAGSTVSGLRKMLTSAGYTDVSPAAGDVGVSTLRNVSGDGLFYLNTHGGVGQTRARRDIFCLWTSTKVDPKTDEMKDIAHDLDETPGPALVYYEEHTGRTLPDGRPETSMNYGITSRFVREYMSFGKDSLVLINACWSANPKPDPADFAAASYEKGAGLYVGWTRNVGVDVAYRAAAFLVDRMLGANQADPKEDSPQRPFNWDAVFEDLRARGLDWDNITQAQLVAVANARASGSPILAPSIDYMLVDEMKEQLHVFGLFGPDPRPDGSVTVNGTAIPIESWKPAEIVCDLPATGTNTAGDVVVTVRKHPSNTVQLTEWRGTVTYTRADAPSLFWTVTFKLHFRADIHLSRKKPHSAPQGMEMPWTPANDSTCHFSVGGTHTENISGATTTIAWRGSGDLPHRKNDPGFDATGSIDTQKELARLVLLINDSNAYTADETIVEPDGGGTSSGSDVEPLYIDVALDDPGHTTTLTLPLTSDYSIAAGSKSATVPALGGSGNATVKLAWSDMSAAHPPDPAAARSVSRRK